ncbi:HNH endonuclease [Mycolicibacterium parafortuitum]|uniref:HNH endonuclease n=1 Tax=Mycolicibacterium parafortuitum TaxID=39692 RepID=A0A7I7U2J0_MYCPF|nr:HNH endonuclease signature motif containing protein [Mycolicibacterium parafortuitum]BBY75165.1 HNH endonuclease [Mycolicibacterium parafortuitum]
MFEHQFDIDPDASQSQLREIVERCERLKSAAAAAQARASALWAEKRAAAETVAGVPIRRRGKGLGTEIALARRDAPNCGGQHLGFANALVHEMPRTLAALERGELSEWRATLIVRESACLSAAHRRQLDAELCDEADGFDGWGNTRVEAAAKRIAARLDAAAVVERSAKAEEDRCVTTRPAPNCMVYLTVLMPVAQGVGMYAALKRAADTTFDGRTRGQVMADTAYERVTGASVAVPASVNLNLVMADTTLAGDDSEPAWLDGYGPVPGGFACKLTGDAVADKDAKAALRRLYRHPDSGQLVAMESRARTFPKALARFIGVRDRTCRIPYCNAPIRHLDHATPDRSGGLTRAANGLGLCEACNYAKEAPGWSVSAGTENGSHIAEFVTPTGAAYRSTAPPLPGRPVRQKVSLMEGRFSVDLVTFEGYDAA